MTPIASNMIARQTPANLAAGERLQQTAANSPQWNQAVENAEEVRDAFVSFVGQTFFGQMIKAMRTSVGKPAYFHGGQAEEIFRSQLDQTMGEQMTEASAETFTGPMFERQFPRHAAILAQHASQQATSGPLAELANLPRK